MIKNKTNIGYHLMAIATMVMWGVTFVSTKILIINGLSPAEIFLLRFILAWICMFIFAHDKLLADSWKDELICFLLGIAGGSMYFMTENSALVIDLASNVSLIVCLAPLLTAILVQIIYKEKIISHWMLIGTVIALVGGVLVVFNGSFILKINPLGSLFAFGAALTWAIYSLLIRYLEGRYSITFITRKVFFYGFLTILPIIFFEGHTIELNILTRTAVWGNLLFLGIMASMVCFWTWNICLERIGTVTCSNYIYLNPAVTLIAAFLILNEQITWLALLGCGLILGGMYLQKK